MLTRQRVFTRHFLATQGEIRHQTKTNEWNIQKDIEMYWLNGRKYSVCTENRVERKKELNPQNRVRRRVAHAASGASTGRQRQC